MIRLILSFIILTLIVTYAIIPFIKYLRKFGRKEMERIENSINDEKADENE